MLLWPEPRQRADEVLEDFRAGLAAVGKNVLRRGAADHGDRAVAAHEAALDVQRLPRALVFVLGDAET